MRYLISLLAAPFIFFGAVSVAEAGIGYPLPGTPTPGSWFDHEPPFNCLSSCGSGDYMTRYDGYRRPNSTTNVNNCPDMCYNGHDALDYPTAIGTNVLAAADGVIQSVYTDGSGAKTIRIWHSALGFSTLYTHLDSYIVTSGNVVRGQHIAESGCTGACFGAHLHFAVYNAQTGGQQMDPYGWTGGGADPYAHNQGVLWGPANSPNPVVTDGIWTYATPKMGEFFDANFTVTNSGTVAFNLAQLYIAVRGPSQQNVDLGGDGNATPIQPGQTRQIYLATPRFADGCQSCTPGTYTISAAAQLPDGSWLALGPSGSGTASVNFGVGATLAVTTGVYTHSAPRMNAYFDANYTVTNQGSATYNLGQLRIAARAPGGQVFALGGDGNSSPLGPGQSRSIFVSTASFAGSCPSCAGGTYEIFAQVQKPDGSLWSYPPSSGSGQNRTYISVVHPTNSLGLWMMQGSSVTSGIAVANLPASGWKAVGIEDMDVDGWSDTLLQNQSTNQIAVWMMNGNSVVSGPLVTATPAAGWSLAGVGPYDGNSSRDLFHQNQSTREIAAWLMNGLTPASGPLISPIPGSGWKMVGLDDLNQDGWRDIILQNQSTWRIGVWLMTGGTSPAYPGVEVDVTPGVGWNVVGTGDFNQDGKSDIVLQHNTTGAIGVWILNGVTLSQGLTVSATPESGRRVVGVGNFNGDAWPDIVLQKMN